MHTISGNDSLFCTFIYAANGGKERKDLWKDLQVHKRIVGSNAWALMGDMNVTLNSNEHSTGSSSMTSDMNDFKECVNGIEVEDLASSGLFYTWTKNLFKAKTGDYTGVLKKLDRIIGNEDLINKYPHAHAVFLPYLISDHSPNVLIIPNVIMKKRKAFKFVNFTTGKTEFIPLVSKMWNNEVHGCQMFNTVKKLKNLKVELKKLTWKDGNVYDKVKCLKAKLSKIQASIDKSPDDKVLREKESACLREYVEAMKEGEQLMYQKAKIKWLSFGDRNNAYFHKVLKSRMNRNKINYVRDCKGNLFQGDDVAEQLVKHFQDFLGKVVEVKECDYATSLIKNKLSSEEASFLIRDVGYDEIKDAMFQIDGNKAPGPNGYSSHFF
ncbi:RNA-directed DNA polymerase, eukaryota, reverse transcriptase zinc-binding domain protein [Tanacetum coccineum]